MLKPLPPELQPGPATPPPLGLYIHIPWCVRKCPYCDFNSHEAADDPLPEAAYLDALTADLESSLPDIWGRTIETIFIGGGTPSLLSAHAIDTLLSRLRALLRLGPDTEITLEANPGTADAGRFREFHAAGINRLSIGVQSFDDRLLLATGRIHDGRQARRAVELAQAAGFQNINLDLMFALPGQDLRMAERDLRIAIAQQPEHISLYQLTVEPHTPFHHHQPDLPDDHLAWQMQLQGTQLLTAHGYGQYEVSAYARPGRRCRHNLNYWGFGDYLGIGAGAHSKLTDPQTRSISRISRVRHPQRYLAAAGGADAIQSRERLEGGTIALEFMMNALRLTEGFERGLFPERTGLPLACLERQMEKARERGLLERDGATIRATERGRRYLNDLLELFVPA